MIDHSNRLIIQQFEAYGQNIKIYKCFTCSRNKSHVGGKPHCLQLQLWELVLCQKGNYHRSIPFFYKLANQGHIITVHENPECYDALMPGQRIRRPQHANILVNPILVIEISLISMHIRIISTL